MGALIRPGKSPLPVPHPDGGVTWLRGTLAEAPWNQIEGFGPEACVHMAWISTPGTYLESPDNDRFLEWSLSFLRRYWRSAGRHVVALGTCIEYQASRRPLVEDQTPILPTTRYARCKNALRVALEEEAGRAGASLCWARLFYPYGEGEHPARLCTSLVRKLANAEEIVLKTPASVKDYIHIDDLAAAILTVLEQRFRGAINLGTGNGVAVREIARTLGEILGRAELIKEAEPAESDPLSFVVADPTKLRALGFHPRVTLGDGLTRLVNHLTR